MRTPWGFTQYSYTWNKDDTNWTDALVAQVPYNVDPRTSYSTGVFVAPIDAFLNEKCFTSY
jgi:hypothetical protein